MKTKNVIASTVLAVVAVGGFAAPAFAEHADSQNQSWQQQLDDHKVTEPAKPKAKVQDQSEPKVDEQKKPKTDVPAKDEPSKPNTECLPEPGQTELHKCDDTAQPKQTQDEHKTAPATQPASVPVHKATVSGHSATAPAAPINGSPNHTGLTAPVASASHSTGNVSSTGASTGAGSGHQVSSVPHGGAHEGGGYTAA